MSKDLYNANAGVKGRDGGPYLDEVEARAAEDRRALLEGREADYDAHKSHPRMKKVTKPVLIQQSVLTNLTDLSEVTAEPVVSVEVPDTDEDEVDDEEVLDDDFEDDEDNEFVEDENKDTSFGV